MSNLQSGLTKHTTLSDKTSQDESENGDLQETNRMENSREPNTSQDDGEIDNSQEVIRIGDSFQSNKTTESQEPFTPSNFNPFTPPFLFHQKQTDPLTPSFQVNIPSQENPSTPDGSIGDIIVQTGANIRSVNGNQWNQTDFVGPEFIVREEELKRTDSSNCFLNFFNQIKAFFSIILYK